MATNPANKTVTSRNGKDVELRSATPNKNYNQQRFWGLVAGNRSALLRMTRPFPLGANIISATLRLVQRTEATGGSRTIVLNRNNQGWKASQVTYNSFWPDIVGNPVTTTKGNGAAGRIWEFDVTQHMQTVSNGAAWRGWDVLSLSTTTLTFWSLDGPPENRPTLEITWSVRPFKPTELSPDGNRAVSLNAPTLGFDFSDVAGSTTMSAYQVQVNNTTEFATGPVLFDTGTVDDTEPQCDLSGFTTWPGIANGTSRYWRVRVRDGAGIWSYWSDPAQFRRVDKSPLILLNPADTEDPYVEDVSPPILWDFAGVQTKWQVILTDPEDHSDWLYNSGKTKGATQAHTIPSGSIKGDESEYRLVLRIWDDVDREGTPGDLAWTVVRRVFRFNRDPSVDVVRNFRVIDQDPRPFARLRWEMDSAPDAVAVFRNEQLVERLDPEDVIDTAEGDYSFMDKTAPPRRHHTWRVSVIRNGKTSKNDPTVSDTLTPRGIWVSGKHRNINVCLLGTDEGSWVQPDVGEDYEPIGAREKVRVISSMRGFEGSISGMLVDYAGNTAQEWKDNLYRLKERPTEPMYLSLSNLLIEIIMSNVTVAPTPTEEIEFNVSFDFFQVGTRGFRWRP